MSARAVREEIHKKVPFLDTQTETCDDNITNLLVSVIAPTPAPSIDNTNSHLPLETQETIMRAVADRIRKYDAEKYYYLGGYRGFGAFVNDKLVDIFIKSSLEQKDYQGNYIVSITDETALTILDNSVRNLMLQYVVLLKCYENVEATRSVRRGNIKSQRNIEKLFMRGVGNLGYDR